MRTHLPTLFPNTIVSAPCNRCIFFASFFISVFYVVLQCLDFGTNDDIMSKRLIDLMQTDRRIGNP